jgi:hypothetical protein
MGVTKGRRVGTGSSGGKTVSWRQDQGSHLFMVRLWSEGAEGQKRWGGIVQHILNGERRTFHDWSTLVDLILEMAETEQVENDQTKAKSKEVPE